MPKLNSKALALMLGAGLCGMAGCQPTSTPPTAVAPSATAPTDEVGQPATDQVQFVALEVGMYVDPATLAVVGISKEYAPTDHVFASVKFRNAMANTPVQVKILDATGTVVADKSIAIADPSMDHINFDFGIPGTMRLTPGSYVADASIDGKSVATQTFEVK